MTDPKLTQFKLLCFDVYGTLVDWETGIYDRIKVLIARAQKSWGRKETLTAFQSVERNLQAQNPSDLYPKILADTYYELAKRLNLPESEELKKASIAFGDSVPDWPVFPDTIQALQKLSQHFRLVVLSNVDKQSFGKSQQILEQHFEFDLIVTAQEIGSYKPNPANFQYMLEKVKDNFGLEKHEVLVTAQSLYHDHEPAIRLGIASSWIARRDAVMGVDIHARCIFKFPTLGDMADSLERELAGK